MNSYPNSSLKRLFDVALCLIIWPFAGVAVTLGAIAVLVTTGKSFIYTQKRVGRGGQIFTMYKLRTLKHNAQSDLSGMRPNDPDILPVGRVLRIWRIDELPQIWNILKGDMSWVGPRPERPHIVERCTQTISNYGQRHDVLPGITGLAQIHNPDATPDDNAAKLQHDLEYVRTASLAMDLKILWKTLVAIG
jgi:lipopolysaccharide/colanic/teichoic acid biosynthesis glycosyltransferase